MTHFDLVVIGTGSGNTIVTKEFADRSVAIVERGTFGGTCINVGCIPTKMFVHAADVAQSAREAARLGVDAHLDGVRWRDVVSRVFDDRIDPIAVSGRDYRAHRNPHVTLFEGTARFTGERALEVTTADGVHALTADHVVLANGSRPRVPDVAGLDEVTWHTSDTIMRIDALPRRLAILGGGVICAEFAHVFSAFGTEVSIVAKDHSLLRHADLDVAKRFTEIACEAWDVHHGTRVTKVEPLVPPDEAQVGGDPTIRLHLDDGGTLDVDTLLVAVGRVPSSDTLDLEKAGVAVDGGGIVVVDAQQRTTADGVTALGDVANHHWLKHVANAEARTIRHNLLHPDDPWETDHRFVPYAVFTRPQVAAVGLTEQEARERGVRHVTATRDVGGVAYGWALEDRTGFCKVIADPATHLLLGAHMVGPDASSLIQPLIQMMSLGQTVDEVAHGQYWIHPALAEVVENALLGLELD